MLALLAFEQLEFTREALNLRLDFGSAGFHGDGLVGASVAHQTADLFGEAVGFGLKGFGFGLNAAALLVQRKQGLNGGTGIDVALGERGNHGLGVGADGVKRQHNLRTGTKLQTPWRRSFRGLVYLKTTY